MIAPLLLAPFVAPLQVQPSDVMRIPMMLRAADEDRDSRVTQ